MAGGWLLGCVLIGCHIYRQQWLKTRDYAEWVSFCDYLNQAIGFALQPLPQTIKSYLPICHGNCHDVLERYWQLLDHKIDLTREQCQKLTNDSTLCEFMYQLGRTSYETEQNKISKARAIWVDKAQQAKHDLQCKASITLKLLIIIGMIGGILWI